MKVIGTILICTLVLFRANAQNKTIVFVCEHGSAKSVIAAAYFNEQAKKRSLAWTAVPRGTNPDKVLPANIEEGLRKDGLLPMKVTPQKLSQADATNAQEIIHFFPLPKEIETHHNTQYWTDIQAVHGDYPTLKEAIAPRLNVLLDSLAKH